MTTNTASLIRHSSTESRPVAYLVPWRVDRRHAPTVRLINTGAEPLWGVTLSLSGAAVMRATAPKRVAQGECLAVTVRGRDIERDTVMYVRWFRPSGEEYLWRLSF